MVKHKDLILLLILTAAVFFSFWPSLKNGFVYDDHFQLVANPNIKDINNLKVLFTTDMWDFSSTMQSIYYRPFHALSYSLIYHLFGLNPFAFHLANVFLHLLCVLLLWRILLKYSADLPAFVLALIFATLPVHVENVAWIAGIHDLLCGAFLFTAFLLYLRGHLYASLLPLFAAFLTKEPAILFPAVVALDHFLFRRVEPKKFFYWLLAASALIFLYLGLRWNALGSLSLKKPDFSYSLWDQILAGAAFAGFYLGKLIVPAELNAFYDYRLPLSLEQLSAGIGALMFFAFLVFLLRKNKGVLLGSSWFFILLFPALIVGAVSQVLFAERYLYIPSAGICLALAALPIKPIHSKALLCLAAVFSLICYSRCQVWQDDKTLWSDTISKSPASPIVNYNLAVVYLKEKDWKKASHFFQKTVELDPQKAEAYNNLAFTRYSMGDVPGAIENLKLYLQHWKKDDDIRRRAVSILQQLENSKSSK